MKKGNYIKSVLLLGKLLHGLVPCMWACLNVTVIFMPRLYSFVVLIRAILFLFSS